MSEERLVPGTHLKWPWCNRCNKPVESVGYETPVEPIWDGFFAKALRHTGEIILSIECHGEKWSISNWRDGWHAGGGQQHDCHR